MNVVAKGVLSGLAIFWMGAPLVHAQQAPAAVMYRAEEVKYIKLASGAESAVLYGDPAKAGLFVSRVKFPAGTKVPPHYHPDVARTVVVLSGTLYFGLGERWDESKMEARPAGAFFSEAPKQPHYAWAKDGEVVLQVTGIGPSGTVNIEQPK